MNWKCLFPYYAAPVGYGSRNLHLGLWFLIGAFILFNTLLLSFGYSASSCPKDCEPDDRWPYKEPCEDRCRSFYDQNIFSLGFRVVVRGGLIVLGLFLLVAGSALILKFVTNGDSSEAISESSLPQFLIGTPESMFSRRLAKTTLILGIISSTVSGILQFVDYQTKGEIRFPELLIFLVPYGAIFLITAGISFCFSNNPDETSIPITQTEEGSDVILDIPSDPPVYPQVQESDQEKLLS